MFDLRECELQNSFIKERIGNVEKHFNEIASKLSVHNKKQGFVRDSGIAFAKSMTRFATSETLNSSLRNSLMQFSDLMLVLQEHQDAKIQRTDAKVVLEFKNYNAICKKAKSDLKRSFETRAKEINKKNLLEKVKGKDPTNWQKITQAELDLCQAKNEATRTMHDLSERIDNFERQKLEDLKQGLMEYIKIELFFHAKAIELYTSSYNTIKDVDVGDDLKEFRDHFKSYISPLDRDLASKTNGMSSPGPSTALFRPADLNSAAKTSQTSASVPNAVVKSPLLKSKLSPRANNTSFKLVPPRKRRQLPQLDGWNKSGTSGVDNSIDGSSIAESKFDLGDHCL